MNILDCVTITAETVDRFVPLIPETLAEGLRRETLFGLGSLLGDSPNGALVYQIEERHARILSLYVDEYDRRNGTGLFLIEKLLEVLEKVPGIYTIRATLPEKAEEAEAFFQAAGARIELQEAGRIRFRLEELGGSALLRSAVSENCIPGSRLGQEDLLHYQRTLEKNGAYLMEGNLWDPPVCRELSWYYKKDGVIRGCVIITQTSTGLCLAMLANQGGPETVPALLCALARCLVEQLPPSTEISLEPVLPGTRSLAERIAPGAEKTTCKTAVLSI